MRQRAACGLVGPAIGTVLAVILLAGGCGKTSPNDKSGRAFQIVGDVPPCCRGDAAESAAEREAVTADAAALPDASRAAAEGLGPTGEDLGAKAEDGETAAPTSPDSRASKAEGGEVMAFTLTSSAFENGKPIPKKYTGEGADVSPPLEWKGVPEGARELALICEDPDAPTKEPWVHWVIYKIPPQTTSLPENVAKTSRLAHPEGALQGKNSWPSGQTIGYRGPMPPPGHGRHRYYFRLYALDAKLVIEPGVTKAVLWMNMKDHIVGQAELMGTYER